MSHRLSSQTTAPAGDTVKVMVVDDSAIIRGFICRYLSEDSSIEVVTTANNGEVAVRMLKDNPQIEVVLLDIEMPVMDGLTALPKMIELRPDLQVIMASTLTKRNAEVSLRAMQHGAVDYVPKPETARSVNASIDFRREIVEKVKAWANRSRKKKGVPEVKDSSTKPAATNFARPTARPTGFAAPSRPAVKPAVVSSRQTTEVKSTSSASAIQLRKAARTKPQILAIGSSTGGPQALMKFFKGFKKKPSVPIVITQHMPATFTAILATHIGEATGWPSAEAKEGDTLMPGHVYVAPGDWHMQFVRGDGKVKVTLNQGPQENFCRPAVDPMYRSLIEIYGDRILGVILTGMGHDGLKGSRDIVKNGGTVFAQDEASSVVWGMPGAVSTAGLCSKVTPIDELGEQAEKQLDGGY
ncbi:chemotaxis response regulator protein-glutamate methylesterase [Temperatibacter marinus]|uniref:chemotaxis response regulator protein-glutamate methylesterase n=1 Tax=Temperatibacter marinus TaxID=1456591 RepID=UPI0035C69B0C